MNRYGIDKGVVRWVRSWLSGRRQRVVIDISSIWMGAGVEWCILRGRCWGHCTVMFLIVFMDDIYMHHNLQIFFTKSAWWPRLDEMEEDRERPTGRIWLSPLKTPSSGPEDCYPAFLLFNLDKCSVMQLLGFQLTKGMEVTCLGDKVLGAQKSERDLGVSIMQSDL